jgi:hypothetical protein
MKKLSQYLFIILLSTMIFACSDVSRSKVPVLNAVDAQSTLEDTAKTLTLLGTYSVWDTKGSSLTYSATSSTSNVVVSVSGSTLTLTPASNWNGTATITAKVNNGIVDSSAQTFTLTVSAVNDAPVLASISNQTTNQSTAKAVTLVGSDADTEDTLTYSATSSNSDVVVSVSGVTLTLTPTATWNGSATITAKVNDGVVDSDAQTFTLTTLNPLTSHESIDPTIAAGNKFGDSVNAAGVVTLPNGNIVIRSRYDSSGATNNGAVHLYNPYTKTFIASFYGDNANDYLGGSSWSSGILDLGNNNFVIASSVDDVGGVTDAGSVMLINGTTGSQIGSTITGDNASDNIGSLHLRLTNGNFVIVSSVDDVDSVSNAGSAMLISGTTDPDKLKQARSSGYRLVQKPINPSELRSLVQHQLYAHH